MTIIKRYSNRKLYDSEAGRYVTIEELGDRIQQGEEINVLDHDTGADLTALTLMQVIFEREKRVGGMLPKAILTSLIQAGNLAVESIRSGFTTFRENNPQIEAEIRRRLDVLKEDGLLAADEFTRLTDMLLSPRFKPQTTTEVPVADPNAADPETVDALQKQIDDLERQIASIKSSKQS